MTLTHNETVKLLAYLAHDDQRTVGEEDVRSWRDASDYGRWTLEEASSAVRQLVNEQDAKGPRIKPADVTRAIRARRQDAAMRQETTERVERNAVLAGPLARALERGSGQGGARHAGADHVDAIYADRGWSPTKRAALGHVCPWCRAQVGDPCSRASRREDTGQVDLSEPHPSRSALTVPCAECAAQPGELCAAVRHELPDHVHPHHGRDVAALGDTGRARRRDTVIQLRGGSGAQAATAAGPQDAA